MYESKSRPDQVVMRIKSFGYSPEGSINYLDAEVDFFFANYWKKKSGSVKTVIFDIIENYGGDSPVPYYAVFTHKPFQEMYTEFKKIKEFENKDIKESFFWNSKAKEIWLNDIKTKGLFDKTKEGDFLPPVAQFCADRDKNCNEGQFQPRKHNFNGKIKIMVDQWCISSCVGFIENMVRLFKGRVQTYGHYDSGDSAYSRVTVAGSIINGKVETILQPMKKARNPDQPEPWVRQVVSVTRSTDEKGEILSGKPQKIDYWVPRKWNQTDEQWVQDVFGVAVKNK